MRQIGSYHAWESVETTPSRIGDRGRGGDIVDGGRFDAVARTLAGSATRRGSLAGLAAGALALVGLDAADARRNNRRCRNVRQTCDRGGQCCGRTGEVACDRVSRLCDDSRLRRDNRCCGTNTARCERSCDCCDPLVCVSGRCVRPTV
jgi:hypothetical protein